MAPLCYLRHRFPPEIIQHAIWLYLRFTLSYRDVEELLAERGLNISYETVRRWVLKFGPNRAHAGVACGHLALHFDRATNRIDHACKLAEQTVACRVDDAAAVLFDLGVGNLPPQCLQRSERAFFVRPHQARVARNVGRQD